MALAASLTLLPALIGLAGPRAGPEGQSSSRTGGAASTPPLSIPRFSSPIVGTALVLVICALPVIAMQWGLSEDPANPAGTRSARFLPGNRLPDVVVVKSAQDLRDPAGLIAIDQVSHRLMEIPGVRKVQSAAWPGGVPWTDASLSSEAGRLADQLDRQGATFVPQVNAIKSLASVLDQVTGAVNELEASVTAGLAGAHPNPAAIDLMISGTRNIKDTTAQVSGYLDPVRGWMGGIANCPGDMLCSAARKVVRSLRQRGRRRGRAVQWRGPHRRGIGQNNGRLRLHAARGGAMRSALGQLRSFVPTLETTIENTIPQVVQLSAFLKNLSTDFADTGEGGFYLSRKALADPSYQTRAAIDVFGRRNGDPPVRIFRRGQTGPGCGGTRTAARNRRRQGNEVRKPCRQPDHGERGRASSRVRPRCAHPRCRATGRHDACGSRPESACGAAPSVVS